jgi:NAD(P)-dependent dehydrogenase (short-subunit alcohol dehydrogenase family)
LRVPAECDRVFAAALERFTGLHILVNNAGLTFTTIDPARFQRAEPQKFWKVPDDIVRAIIARPPTSPPTGWPVAWRPRWSSKTGAASST